MGKRDVPDMIPLARRPEKMRAVPTPEEVARPIDAAPGPKYRAALRVAYGAGLRASESQRQHKRLRQARPIIALGVDASVVVSV